MRKFSIKSDPILTVWTESWQLGCLRMRHLKDKGGHLSSSPFLVRGHFLLFKHLYLPYSICYTSIVLPQDSQKLVCGRPHFAIYFLVTCIFTLTRNQTLLSLQVCSIWRIVKFPILIEFYAKSITFHLSHTILDIPATIPSVSQAAKNCSSYKISY